MLTQRERLQSLQKETGVKRTESGADVPEKLYTRLNDEGYVAQSRKIAKNIPELEAMVAGVGLGELGKFPISPVEFATIDDDASDGGSVAADELRR